VRAKVDGGGEDAAGAKSASSPTQDPGSELWIRYYAAAQREADVRAAERARREQSAQVMTRLIWVVALVGAVALFAFLR
jgi:hypothetical protein